MKEYPYNKDEHSNNYKKMIKTLKEQDDRLKFAVWDHMEYLNKVIGMDVLDTLDIVDDIVTSALVRYDEEEEYFEE